MGLWEEIHCPHVEVCWCKLPAPNADGFKTIYGTARKKKKPPNTPKPAILRSMYTSTSLGLVFLYFGIRLLPGSSGCCCIPHSSRVEQLLPVSGGLLQGCQDWDQMLTLHGPRRSDLLISSLIHNLRNSVQESGTERDERNNIFPLILLIQQSGPNKTRGSSRLGTSHGNTPTVAVRNSRREVRWLVEVQRPKLQQVFALQGLCCCSRFSLLAAPQRVVVRRAGAAGAGVRSPLLERF